MICRPCTTRFCRRRSSQSLRTWPAASLLPSMKAGGDKQVPGAEAAWEKAAAEAAAPGVAAAEMAVPAGLVAVGLEAPEAAVPEAAVPAVAANNDRFGC